MCLLDRAAVPHQGMPLSAGVRVPDPIRPVRACAGQQHPAADVTAQIPRTASVWPSIMDCCCPVAGSQIRTVPSELTLAGMTRSSRVNAHTSRTELGR